MTNPRNLLISLLLLPLAHAASSTSSTASGSASTSLTSILFFNISSAPFDASVISADATAATLSILCPTSASASCPLGTSGATITAAGASYDYLASTKAQYTESIHCALTGAPGGSATTGTCYTTAGVSANTASVVNATVKSSDLTYYPVTITGGLNYIAAASSSAAAAASSAAAASTSASASAGATATSGSAASSTASTAAAASSTAGAAAAVVGRSVAGSGIGAAVVGLLSWFVL